MGKVKKVSQISQSSMKICKNDRKQMNSMIKVLKPKVYITESANFKRLVQELTGNGKVDDQIPIPIPIPIPFQMPYAEPVMQIPVVEIQDDLDLDLDHVSYQEHSLDSSMDDSSEASMAQEFCVPDALFNANVFDQNKVDLELDIPGYGDIESWLFETENSFSYNSCDDVSFLPTIQQQVGVYSYDFSDLMI